MICFFNVTSIFKDHVQSALLFTGRSRQRAVRKRSKKLWKMYCNTVTDTCAKKTTKCIANAISMQVFNLENHPKIRNIFRCGCKILGKPVIFGGVAARRPESYLPISLVMFVNGRVPLNTLLVNSHEMNMDHLKLKSVFFFLVEIVFIIAIPV